MCGEKIQRPRSSPSVPRARQHDARGALQLIIGHAQAMQLLRYSGSASITASRDGNSSSARSRSRTAVHHRADMAHRLADPAEFQLPRATGGRSAGVDCRRSRQSRRLPVCRQATQHLRSVAALLVERLPARTARSRRPEHRPQRSEQRAGARRRCAVCARFGAADRMQRPLGARQRDVQQPRLLVRERAAIRRLR